MAYFDEFDNENKKDTEYTEEASSLHENEAPATEEKEEERPAGASVAYTPEDHYTSNGAYRAPYTPSYEQPPKKKGGAGVVVLCTVLAIVLVVGSFFGGNLLGRLQGGLLNPGGGGTSGGSTTDTPGTSGIDRGEVTWNVVEKVAGLAQEGSVPAVVEAVENMVVEIRTETAVNDYLYGDYVQSGAGSGVIVSADGLILTCNHVIEGAELITVTLANGKEYKAEVYGTDSWSDLALLKIEEDELAFATFARAPAEEEKYSYMKVGETVVAIGNPLGELGGSVSVGVISALGREVTVEGMPMTLLQIDASVNPGNSGGGLFNLNGELIGIVNAKSTGDAVEGIGFAIPSTYATEIAESLYEQGYVSGRPYLGMYFQPTSTGYLQIAEYDYNDELPEDKRLQYGDILYEADGVSITAMTDLQTVLAKKKPGDTLTIKVQRSIKYGYRYQTVSIEVTVAIHEYIPTTVKAE
ncbi:MAG: trypsin-like peptidase domain-containing protein [Clostridia bacterium]|nr:trypsin-like peptidase domain-containing protein [Clostridia bacterium]